MTIECVGGPCDGERVPEHGLFWRVIADVVTPESDVPGLAPEPEVRPGPSGTYVLDRGKYRWEPDA